MWQNLACFQEKILGQFAALFFHQAAKIRHYKKNLCETGGSLYFSVVKQTISCLHRGNSKFLDGPTRNPKKIY